MTEDPLAGAWRALGQQLAASRRAAGLTQHELAPLSGYSRSTVGNAETGHQRSPREFWERCDAVLGTGTALARGHDEVLAADRDGHLRAAADARQARAGAARGAAEGVGGGDDRGITGDGAAGGTEQLRAWLDAVLTDGMAGEAGLDAWELAVLEHGRATRSRPAAEHVIELGADLAELGQAIRASRTASSLRGLVRLTAQVAGLMCLQFVRLDEGPAWRGWAGTARTAAVEAGDAQVLSWVLAQAAYGYYYDGDLMAAVTAARQSQSLMRRTPHVGGALAAALEARAQAARGRSGEARRALERAEAVLLALPAESRTASAFGYTEAQFRFHQENAYMQLGDLSRAIAAQERALELCGPGDYTDWALTRLDRAYCLARGGDSPAALGYASDTLMRLRAAQGQGIIARRAGDLVRGLPARYRSGAAVREFEGLVAAMAGPGENPVP